MPAHMPPFFFLAKVKSFTNFIHLFDDASIINSDVKNYTNQAYQVFELLKFNKLSNNKNIVIIPDGLLNFLPFEALLTDKTTTTSFAKILSGGTTS